MLFEKKTIMPKTVLSIYFFLNFDYFFSFTDNNEKKYKLILLTKEKSYTENNICIQTKQ